MSDDNLKRNLGLIEVIAISMGSMIGSGIFILPGVAYLEVGSPSVALAFLVGGILTIPTALSAAEMSTAMPQSGGSYLYIQKGMGPLPDNVRECPTTTPFYLNERAIGERVGWG